MAASHNALTRISGSDPSGLGWSVQPLITASAIWRSSATTTALDELPTSAASESQQVPGERLQLLNDFRIDELAGDRTPDDLGDDSRFLLSFRFTLRPRFRHGEPLRQLPQVVRRHPRRGQPLGHPTPLPGHLRQGPEGDAAYLPPLRPTRPRAACP